MAAGLGFKTFTTGEVLTAADVNGYLMQGVLVFASEAARNSAITSPQEGQFAYTKDTNSLWYYTGSAWVASGATGDIEGVTAGTGISGGGTSGTVTITNSMATEITAKADLIVGTGNAAFDNLAVGANGTVLTADSTVSPTGLKWAAPASGGMTLLSTTSASGSSITISSISQSYKNLYILGIRFSGTADGEINLRINGDTGSNYMYASTLSANATNGAAFSTSTTNGRAGDMGSTTAYNVAAFFEMTIPRYTETEYKKIHVRSGYKTSSTQYFLSGTSWDNTAAITSLTFFTATTYSSGTIYVYGVN